MAWTAPMTAIANTVFTAAQFNTHVRDNLLATEAGTATTAGRYFVTDGPNAYAQRSPETATVSASESTTSTTFADLATIGPSITIETGANAFVSWSCESSNSTSAYSRMGIAVGSSISTTIWVGHTNYSGGTRYGETGAIYSTTPGLNTFTAKYWVDGGTGTWANRTLTVLPL